MCLKQTMPIESLSEEGYLLSLLYLAYYFINIFCFKPLNSFIKFSRNIAMKLFLTKELTKYSTCKQLYDPFFGESHHHTYLIGFTPSSYVINTYQTAPFLIFVIFKCFTISVYEILLTNVYNFP